jgi:hypothetical protein
VQTSYFIQTLTSVEHKPFMKNFLFSVIFFVCLCAFAQDSGPPGPVTSPPVSPDTSGSAKPSENSASAAARQAKARKKGKKRSNEQDDLTASTFSEAVANAVIRRLGDGLEGHSQRLMLSIFDPDKMKEYPRFENQIEAFFTQYQAFRVHLRVLQATSESERGIILTDVEMEAAPGGDAPPVRKQDQLRLELERGSKGWKIVDLNPRDFFS